METYPRSLELSVWLWDHGQQVSQTNHQPQHTKPIWKKQVFLFEIVQQWCQSFRNRNVPYIVMAKILIGHQVLGDQYLRMFSEHAWMKCPLDYKHHQATKIIGDILYIIFEEFQQRLHRISFPMWLPPSKFSFQATLQLPYEACLWHRMWLLDRAARTFGGGNLWLWPFGVPGWINNQTSVVFY